MIINLIGQESSIDLSTDDSGNISGDSDITAADVMNNKIAYNSSNEKLVGTAPFEYIGTEDGIDNYRVLEDEMYILLPNNEKRLLKTGYITIDDEWIQTTLPASARWNSVCYGNDKFVAVAGNGSYTTNIAAYSTDGINWTKTTLPVSKYWSSVCYGNDKFVAVVFNSNIAAYSTDGINWTQITMPSSTYWTSVCYGNGKFVAVSGFSSNSNIAAYSEDGINWIQIALPVSKTWHSVCYGNGKFVAVSGFSSNSNIAAYKNSYSYNGLILL